MNYQMTILEKTVESIYKKIGVDKPGECIEVIADKLGVDLIYGRFSFFAEGVICIDLNLSKEKAREVFAHELCHCLFHVGNQLEMYELYREYQEFKAENFAMHFCIPTFMLLNMELPQYISEAIEFVADEFGVTNELALKRLEHYANQKFGQLWHEKMYSINAQAKSYNHRNLACLYR